MEQQLLDKIRKECREKQSKREKCNSILYQVYKLQKNESVRKYIELMKKLESLEYKDVVDDSDEQILYNTFHSYQHMIKETNNIYVYMGTFMLDKSCDIEHGPKNIKLEKDDPRAEFRIYKNLEDESIEQIPMHMFEQFEKSCKVIYPKIENSEEKYFYELQKEYINLLVIEGNGRASRLILFKKYR